MMQFEYSLFLQVLEHVAKHASNHFKHLYIQEVQEHTARGGEGRDRSGEEEEERRDWVGENGEGCVR